MDTPCCGLQGCASAHGVGSQELKSYCCGVAGVDIGAVLARVGITVNATNEKVGTVAIAYAAHKALSPVRFPPTVALTPVVARLLGRGKDGSSANGASSNGPTP